MDGRPTDPAVADPTLDTVSPSPTYRDFADSLLASLGVGQVGTVPRFISVSDDLVLEIIPTEYALRAFNPVSASQVESASDEPVDSDEDATAQLVALLSLDRITYIVIPHFASDDARERFAELALAVGTDVFGRGFANALNSDDTQCQSCVVMYSDTAGDSNNTIADYFVPSTTDSVRGYTQSRGPLKWTCGMTCWGISWAVWLGCWVSPPGPDCEEARDAAYEACMHFCRTGKPLPKPEDYY